MRTLWLITRHELETTLHSRQSWLLLLAAPALAIYLVGLAVTGLASSILPTVRVDVLDQDQSATSAALVTALAEANPALILSPLPDAHTPAQGDAHASDGRLAAGEIDAAIHVPARFGAALNAGEVVTLEFRSGVEWASAAIALGALQRAAIRLGGPLVAARLSGDLAGSLDLALDAGSYATRLAEARAAWGPPAPIRVAVETSGPNDRLLLGARIAQNGFTLSVPSITSMFVMISVLGMAQSLAEERMWGVLRRLAMLPISRAQLLGGKVLAACLLGLAQAGVLLGLGELLGVGLGRATWVALLVAVAYVLAVAALALALVALARSPGQASALANLVWVLLVPLGGGWWPLIYVPEWLRWLGHISPVAWFVDALQALLLESGALTGVLAPVGALLLMAGALVAVGIAGLNLLSRGDDDDDAGAPTFGAPSQTGH
jgi:ABC-2 type transport system permease protein